MPQEHRPHDLLAAPNATPLADEWIAEHRAELIVEELVRAEQAYWQRAGSVDAMLAMVL